MVISPSYATEQLPTTVAVTSLGLVQSPTAGTGAFSPTKSLYGFNVNSFTTAGSKASILKNYTITPDKTEFVFYYAVDSVDTSTTSLNLKININGIDYSNVAVPATSATAGNG